jgi:hypothetical protein
MYTYTYTNILLARNQYLRPCLSNPKCSCRQSNPDFSASGMQSTTPLTCPQKQTRTSDVCQQLKFITKKADFVVFLVGVGLSPLGTAATSGLLYKSQMIDEGDCGAIGGMKIGRGNQSTRRKPAPAPLCLLNDTFNC